MRAFDKHFHSVEIELYLSGNNKLSETIIQMPRMGKKLSVIAYSIEYGALVVCAVI